MMITRAYLITLVATCFVLGCSADRSSPPLDHVSASAPPIVETGEAIAVRITANKHKCRVGEGFLITGSVTNGTKVATFVQTERPFGFFTTRLTVTVPGGNQFVYTPYAFKKLPQVDATFYSAVQPNESVVLFELRAKGGIIHHGQDYWQCTASNEKLSPPFESRGKYSLRLDYLDLNPKKEAAFKGGAFSEVTIEIE